MNEFRFAEPQWVNLLWAVVGLGAILMWLEIRGRSALDRFLSLRMQSRLVHASSVWRRRLALLLWLAALGAMVLAVMRPQWGATQRVLPRMGAQIMICLDVSKSMLAEDTVPNRLECAKAEISDLLDLLQGEQVGLIAFAGKASVISPMTSDFGFLKLLLENVGPRSVGQGGTRLEEPIRKAVDGFGEAADISRVILLITDGEDHDSFPLEAADEARLKGIKMITIGFGDEAGTKIQFTDPRTGVRETVTDANGSPVISRLDGETLREIALRTEGAYIPAGTGALDLASIHRRHIVPLMRGKLDAAQQVIRNEAYQWAVMAGLTLLVLSLLISQGGNWQPRDVDAAHTSATTAAAALLMLCLVTIPATDAKAQRPDTPSATGANNAPAIEPTSPSVRRRDDRDAAPRADSPGANTPGTEEQAGNTQSAESKPAAVDPRATYNEALAYVRADAEKAAKLLQSARKNAGTDGEVRFRAAYNLGWVEVTKADELLESQPEKALQHLRMSADWFRQAIRIRPKNMDARYNLEIVMRRALELADALAQQDRDVASQLDQLIQQQRELLSKAGLLVDRLTGEEPPQDNSDLFRREFRALATTQRQVLSETQALNLQVAEELNSLDQKQDQATPEDGVRKAQLQGVAHYLERSTQRLGQARSQLRRQAADRAYRRSSLGLIELKRARDMLRPPNEILQMLLGDTAALLKKTQRFAQSSGEIVEAQLNAKPQWLTKQLLVETQVALRERTREWSEQMQQFLTAQDQQQDQQQDPNVAQPAGVEQEQLERIRPAPALVARAADAFAAAEAALENNEPDQAAENQLLAYESLADALELFLDLRGLIEAAFATENQLKEIAQALDEMPREQILQIASRASQLQEKNLSRLSRLEEELAQEQMKLDAPASPSDKSQPSQPQPSEEQQAAAQERLEIARRLVNRARDQMVQANAALADATKLLPPNQPNVTEKEAEAPQIEADAPQEPPSAESSESTRNKPDNLEPDQRADIDGQSTEAEPSSSQQTPKQDEAKKGEAKEVAAEGVKAAGDEAATVDQVDSTPAARQLVASTKAATAHLQELRRLFFSIIEHLRETAQRQANLNDSTQQLATADRESLKEQLPPLAEDQDALSEISQQIAEALRAQAEKTPDPSANAPGAPQDKQQQQQQQQELTQTLEEAAEHVEQAVIRMRESKEQMGSEAPEIASIRPPQDTALEELSQALALLVPPEQQNNDDQPSQDQQDQQDQQQDQADQEQQRQQQQQKQQENMTANQLLQLIRDREAQRRRDKENRSATTSAPVDKDW